MTSNIPIYLFPGMSAQFPIFHKLIPLLPTSTVIQYPTPASGESLSHFAHRIAELLPSDCFVAGVSFGGIVAQEVARVIRARACFLISSIRGLHELPPWLRVWRWIGTTNCQRLLNGVGRVAALFPAGLCTRSTLRLRKLSGASGVWYRWATSAVLGWQPQRTPPDVPLIQIHGDADMTFPIRYTNPDIMVPNGLHALPVSHPEAVAKAITTYIARTA
ncbi:MAG: alpha/beta hydrolase [Planctomycetota bacterium]